MKKNNDFKIDFMGIGVEKAASSWIAECLREHPQICFSKQKEIRFFDKNYHRGLEFYESFFDHCESDKIKGEYTPRNLVKERVPQRVRKYFPQVKLIVCFRNPIERIYSHYHFKLSHNRIDPHFSFEEFLDNSPECIKQGYYYTHLQNWFKFFPQNQFIFLIHEDIKKDPLSSIQRVYRFLEVDDSFKPDSLNQRVNITPKKQFKSFLLLRFLKRSLAIARSCKQSRIGSFLVSLLKKLKFDELFRFIFHKNVKKKLKEKERKPMSEETRKKLQQIYKDEIQDMEKLLNRDLSFWR